MNPSIPEAISRRVEAILDSRVVESKPVARGYTPAMRFVVRTADGRSAFVKAASNDDTARWLLAERRVYERIRGDFLPRMLGFDEAPSPILVLEDLSAAHWPPPWTPCRVSALQAALERVHATTPPDGLVHVDVRGSILNGWSRVAADPTPFLSLGVVDRAWLDRCLPTLVRAEADAPSRGDAMLHFDVRSDNVCFDGDRAILVDWNWTCLGDARLDAAFFAASLAAEGGPSPDDFLPGEPALAAMTAGYFASQAGTPPPFPGSRVRALQRTQLEHGLPWAIRALGLPTPATPGQRTPA